MPLQVNLPESVFPLQLDEENALRVPYNTNLLFPTLGPAVATRYVSRFARVIEDLAVAATILDRVRRFKLRYGRLPELPTRTAPIDPYVAKTSGYMEAFVKPVRELFETPVALTSLPLGVTGSKPAFGPDHGARAKGAKGRRKASPAPGTRLDEVPSSQREGLEGAALLEALAVPSMVLQDLHTAGVIRSAGAVIIDAELLADATKLPVALTARLAALVVSSTEADAAIAAAAPLVQQALRQVDLSADIGLADLYKADASFRTNLARYLLSRMDPRRTRPGPIVKAGGLQLPADEGMTISREWALQRHEELVLALGKPVLRGPIGATSVAPRSKRVHTETETRTIIDERSRSTREQRRTQQSQGSLSAERFRQSLDNLSEVGIASASSFSNDSTLLSTLSEQRRSAIDSVVREISSANEETTLRRSELVTGRSTEYTTEGKDEHRATTELAFQVVVPVDASVRLRGFGLAWCPRVISPFLKLHGVIAAFEADQKAAYIAQHYVPLPVKPALKTDTRTEVFEVQIDGDDPINTKTFSRTFELTDPNSFIDLDGITAVHRNGAYADFDWNERWNLDDLEKATARVSGLALSADGKRLTGTAVLETTDPEFFNRSFVTITVPILTFTDETVAALAAHEQAQQERSFKEAEVRSRAAQLAALKRDELIASYESRISLQSEAFRALIRRVFADANKEELSLIEELVYRCIRWDDASIEYESQPMDHLPYPQLPPDHFMNCPAIRFFLPIAANAEALLFETFAKSGQSYHETSASRVLEVLGDARSMAKSVSPDGTKSLDSFPTEIIIGRHLEAVLSHSEFSTRGA